MPRRQNGVTRPWDAETREDMASKDKESDVGVAILMGEKMTGTSGRILENTQTGKQGLDRLIPNKNSDPWFPALATFG